MIGEAAFYPEKKREKKNGQYLKSQPPGAMLWKMYTDQVLIDQQTSNVMFFFFFLNIGIAIFFK